MRDPALTAAADVFTVVSIASPFLFAYGVYRWYLAWTKARGGEFVEDFLPECGVVAREVTAVDDAMIDALLRRPRQLETGSATLLGVYGVLVGALVLMLGVLPGARATIAAAGQVVANMLGTLADVARTPWLGVVMLACCMVFALVWHLAHGGTFQDRDPIA